VVVIGGLGSLEGALVGALLVGVVRELGITFFPEIELAVLYLMAAVVLLIRPAGLFGRPGAPSPPPPPLPFAGSPPASSPRPSGPGWSSRTRPRSSRTGSSWPSPPSASTCS